MHPKYKRKAAKMKAMGQSRKSGDGQSIMDEQKQLQARKFPGLSMPDQEWGPGEKYVDEGAAKEVHETLPESLSTNDTMAQLESIASRRNRPAAEDYLDGEPAAKKMRSTISSGHDGSSGRRGEYEPGGFRDSSRHGRPTFDERPVLYKIYNGTIANITDFGAFVTLDGVERRVNGNQRSNEGNLSRSCLRMLNLS